VLIADQGSFRCCGAVCVACNLSWPASALATVIVEFRMVSLASNFCSLISPVRGVTQNCRCTALGLLTQRQGRSNQETWQKFEPIVCVPPLCACVSRELGALVRLRLLNAMNNQLTSLPEELCNLTSLYRLGLKSNALEALPDNFGGLSGLVELFLTDNCLTTLPESIGQCSKLVKLQACLSCVLLRLHS
jgi:hypothetical protein